MLTDTTFECRNVLVNVDINMTKINNALKVVFIVSSVIIILNKVAIVRNKASQ